MSKGGKTIAFKSAAPAIPPAADQWVSNREGEGAAPREAGTVAEFRSDQPAKAAAPAEKMARFTFDVPESLHRRIKVQCAGRGVKMADVMRELLEREFPAS